MTGRTAGAAALWSVLGVVLVAAAPHPARGLGMVAADHVEAARAGSEMLARGGNAVDAAVAAALSAGVVQPAGSGLGGGGFAVVALPDGRRTVVDFREVAPASSAKDRFTAEGLPKDASRKGALAVGVPGESRGLAWLLAHHGTMAPKQVAAPAIAQANRGFALGPHLAGALSRTQDVEVKALFSTVDLRPGTTVYRKVLAQTLTRWALSAGEDLHTGYGARAIAAEVGPRGPTPTDLAGYQVLTREPIRIRWRGREFLGMPPPSSGGIVLAQALRVLEDQDLAALGHNSSAYVHAVVEALKHGYADRAHHVGDPAFVDVPTERLLSDARVAEVRAAFDPARTRPPEAYGPLLAPPTDGGTQHISAVDAKGGAVALTTTINGDFGSGMVVEPLGLILNNQMDDFAAAPGVPNLYGLVGAEANAVAAGKRPTSSMSPTVLLDDQGRVELVIGASGGSFIPSATLQVLLNVLVFDMDPQQAVAAPRFHHQWLPDELFVDSEFPADVVAALQGRGHVVRQQRTRQACDRDDLPFFDCFRASVQVIQAVDGELRGGADPAKGGGAVGAW